MEELEYTIKQNKRAIELALKGIVDAVEELQHRVQSDNWTYLRDWTDGYVARDVAKVTALLARQQASIEALQMVNPQE